MVKSIRQAVLADLDRLMEIYEIAKRFMQQSGNPNQWINGYPQPDFIVSEINNQHCWVCLNEDDCIIATFCFVPGPDDTYAQISEGEWLSDVPYHVIHRLASDGSCRGIAQICIDWCDKHSNNIRADTHADNKIMQYLLEKNSFIRCGIIRVANGTPRIAYQRLPK